MVVIFALLYAFAVILLTCHMVVNHGWYWIFLLLFASVKLNRSTETVTDQDQKDKEVKEITDNEQM